MTTNGQNVDPQPYARHAAVKDYYSKVLQTSKDLKTSACTAGGRPHEKIRELLRLVPKEVSEKFYGCGSPLPLGIGGLTPKDRRPTQVLDLGCGSGRDCYVLAALVGEGGSVIGLDMSPAQLEVAERHAEEFTRSLGFTKHNMRFVEGHIEYLDRAGVPDESVDLIISNCVINLSPDKQRILSEAYRVLKPGGELYFSDVYCDRRLQKSVQGDEVMWGECISGALYTKDFERLARAVGFMDVRLVASSPIAIGDRRMQQLLGSARFCSQTLRLFKLPGLLEDECEDYGHVVKYKGSIPGHEEGYKLDEDHFFEAGRPYLACGNTAALLGEQQLSWLSPHFQVIGDRSMHYGTFGCEAARRATGSFEGKRPAQKDGGCSSGSC